jgi:hypothetical protein
MFKKKWPATVGKGRGRATEPKSAIFFTSANVANAAATASAAARKILLPF